MKDTYKSTIIKEQLVKMAEDEYYIVRLKGDTGKAINLNEYALRLLQAYYDGVITEQQIDAIKL